MINLLGAGALDWSINNFNKIDQRLDIADFRDELL
jgi:hypothetical protein